MKCCWEVKRHCVRKECEVIGHVAKTSVEPSLLPPLQNANAQLYRRLRLHLNLSFSSLFECGTLLCGLPTHSPWNSILWNPFWEMLCYIKHCPPQIFKNPLSPELSSAIKSQWISLLLPGEMIRSIGPRDLGKRNCWREETRPKGGAGRTRKPEACGIIKS